MSLRTFALLTFSLLPLAGRGFAQEPFSATNLELAVSSFGISANRLLFSVSEFSQGGADLNGDGDSVDRVLHVHDLETGTTTNLEVEQAAGSGRVYGKWLVFLVDESRPGGADLNRDGDSEDHVFHVHDLETGTTTNLEVAIVCDFFVSGNWLVFPVSERERGGADLNRDGDSEDSVVHVHDLETGTATNLELAIAPVGDPLQCFISALPVSGNWLVFMVSERGQGGADLNRDGDSEDSVLHVHDLETGTTTNLELASNRFDWRVYGKWLLFAVRESVQGGVDLNRDGDSEDLVLHLHDLETGTTTNLELATTGRHERVFGKWLVFVVWERTQGGVDLNRDGDSEDLVLHLHDLETGTTTNLELASLSIWRVSGNRLVFLVWESAQGGVDLNQDGDSEDVVLHLHDLETGTTTNLELASGVPALSGKWLVFSVRESSQGGADLNDDGDSDDPVLHVHDLEGHTTTNLEVAAASGSISGNWFVFVVEESRQGATDLNGDGDAEDRVVHVHDLDTGTTTNLELAHSGGGRILYGTRLFFRVSEQGGQDLNGDGDSEDSVLHLHDLDTGTTTNLELAGRVSFSSGKWLAFAVSESEQGADLNGDGDSDDDSVLHVADWSTFSPLPSFLRGDCNSDGEVTGSVTDAVFLLEFNFLGGPRPPCLAACDANGDGEVTGSVTDAVYLLGFNFLGTAPPPGPFPHCRSVRALSALERDAALGCETVPECP